MNQIVKDIVNKEVRQLENERGLIADHVASLGREINTLSAQCIDLNAEIDVCTLRMAHWGADGPCPCVNAIENKLATLRNTITHLDDERRQYQTASEDLGEQIESLRKFLKS
jgi:predicted  nucleic acid-binding Zn-ribbon protein